MDASLRHPIETLVDEHRTILAVLVEMERECRSLEGGSALREAFWARTLQFLRDFERLHHDKEEGLLFCALDDAGSPASSTAVLRSEHGRCRLWCQGIAHAVARRDRLQLVAAVQGYVDLERLHIRKENELLFPLARQVLSAEVFAGMASAFDARDDGPIQTAPAGSGVQPKGAGPCA